MNRTIPEGTPMRKVCPDCGNKWIEGDRYCRFCGSPTATPTFTPERFATIYGPPPMNRLHQCAACGHEWVTCLMVDREKYCPLCGGEAPVIRESER